MRRMKTRAWRVRPDQEGTTLQDFLAGALQLSRNRAKSMIDRRLVFINSKRVWMARHELRPGDTVEAPDEAPVSRPVDVAPPTLRVLFQDDHYLVIDKPAGLLANGADSAESVLRAQLGAPALRAAHRLDRDTSGCLLFARDPQAFETLVEAFRNARILKLYHALAAGRIEGRQRTIDRTIDREPAMTHLKVLSANDLASHVRLKIDTGRTHQIRLHLLQIGHPLLGERNYGQRLVLPPDIRHVERQMLHAAAIQFESPLTREVIRAESPLPADFSGWLRRLHLK